MLRCSVPTLLALAAVCCLACTADPGPPGAAADAGVSADGGGAWTLPERAVCPGRYGGAQDLGNLQEALLTEASGLAVSPQHAGVVWLNNDAGDGPTRLFAATPQGQALARLKLKDVHLADPEDLQVAPCPGGAGACLWVADTGNNNLDRTDQAVYAVPEPAERPLGDLVARQMWRFPVHFPGDPVNCEALAVLPDASGLYFFEKTELPQARVFRTPGPLQADVPAVLEELGRMDVPGLAVPRGHAITGASLHPGGGRLVLRTYSALLEYRFTPPLTPAALLETAPALVIYGDMGEPQGESVSYDQTGMGLLTVSEGVSPTVHAYGCP